MIKKEKDHYESSNTTIEYEPAPIPESAIENSRRNSKPIRGLWSVPATGYNLYRRPIYDRFHLFLERIIIIYKKGIDILRINLYNEYRNKKLRKDKNKMSTKNVTKQVKNENSKENKSAKFDWNKLGRGIIGLGLLISVASMIFAGIVIFMGTGKDLVPKVLIIPMVLHAAIILVKQFTTKGDK